MTDARTAACILGTGCRYPDACTGTCLARETIFERCPDCRGQHGATKSYLVADAKLIRLAMSRPDLFDDIPVPIHKDECSTCSGTGKVPAAWVTEPLVIR